MSWPWWAGALAAVPWWGPGLVSTVMPPPKPRLKDYKPLPPDQSPFVSIIVPARNEAANIERCIRSILTTEYPSYELIVVDDRSTDDTAAIAERLPTPDSRLTVIRGADLPEGWYGKPWACWQGYQRAKGKVLLFTDADTAHSPLLLPRAVAALEHERTDLLTVMPHQEMLTFWERVVQPFFFLFIGLRYGSFKRMNRNRKPINGIANGQFILVTRESYEWVGGHKKVWNTVIEDLMLGVEYLRAGRREFFALADEDMSTRMYSSLPGIIEGWSKNMFRGMMWTFKSKALTAVGMVLAMAMPLFFLLPLVMIVVGALTRDPARLAFGIAGYLGAALLFAMFMRAGKAPMKYGLAYPAGAVVMIYIFLRSLIRGTRKVEWKGRTYSHA